MAVERIAIQKYGINLKTNGYYHNSYTFFNNLFCRLYSLIFNEYPWNIPLN